MDIKTLVASPKAKGLIFDLDGTLADTMPVHYKACQDVCVPRGFDFPLDFFFDMAGIPTIPCFAELVSRFSLDADPKQLAKLKEERFLELIGLIKPIYPVENIAKKYYGVLPMSIGTGGERISVDKTLRAIGYGDTFDIRVCSEDVKKHKPNPETFLKCAELMKINPKDCQVFEDGDLGINAALEAGMIATDVRPFLPKFKVIK